MNKEKLESAKNIFFIALGTDIAVTALVVISNVWSIGALNDIDAGRITPNQSMISTMEFWDSFSKLMILTMIGVGLSLVSWLNKCYSYAKESIRASGFKNEGWTTFGWIIPIFNIFKPYQILKEIYMAGSPTYDTPEGWKKENGSALLLTWWFFWVITHFVGWLATKAMFKSNLGNDLSLPQSISAIELQNWFCCVFLVVSILWFFVANALTSRLLMRKQIVASSEFQGPSATQDGKVQGTPASPSQPMAPQSAIKADVSKTPDTRRTTAATTSQNISTAAEEFWSAASAELDGPDRRPGLWARVFSEAQGNEPIAKSNYLRHRADELQHLHLVLLEQERLNAEAIDLENRLKAETAARAAAVEHLSEQQRAYAFLPKGACPNCDRIIPFSADPCPYCGATFGQGSWKVLPVDDKDQIKTYRARYCAGKNLTVDELIFLASKSSQDRPLTLLIDRVRGETLLHLTAKFGLQHEASLLIANGANAATQNFNGERPFELAQDSELRKFLFAAAST